jgi:hypothetical protein
VKVRQETTYPEEQGTKLMFTCEKPVELSVSVRRPVWATAGYEIRVNGRKESAASQPGSYQAIMRTWKTGDTIEVVMPFGLRIEGFRDNPKRFAFLHGPIVLCAEVDTKKPFPAVVVEPGQVLASLKPVAGKALTFTGPGEVFRIAGQVAGGITLEPFYKMHGSRRYMVYFDAFSPSEWRAKEDAYKAELLRDKELETRTVDAAKPGYEQNERDHKLKGEKTSAGDFSERKWRHATDGGWFSWELKVLSDKPLELWVTYWGGDAGGRIFDILIDGQKLTTQRLERNKPDQFYDGVYAIPAEMIKGKEKVVVRFQAHPNAWAGGVFGVRVMKKE